MRLNTRHNPRLGGSGDFQGFLSQGGEPGTETQNALFLNPADDIV